MDMIDPTVVELSRFQFALTALYHFMFVPLTLGLTFMLTAMETVYVVTGRKIYKDMAMFWGKLFGINFALGVATGLTMEFEFGTNWSMYSRYFGDIFGTPLALEGLMAFFMESTFIGMMFFGWDRLSKPVHLAITYLVALGSNLSALWILIANASMNVPEGTHFDPETMRLQFDSFVKVVFNPDAQAKFVHTSVAGYVCASLFVMGISSFYLLRKQHRQFAARSFRMAALFGIVSTVAVITLGDVLGRLDYAKQPTKIAAIEGLWETSKPPYAPWLLFAIPDNKAQTNYLEIGVPYVLTPLITHEFDQPITGMHELQNEAEPHIRAGIEALTALRHYGDTHNKADLDAFRQHKEDLGFGFLATQFAPHQDVTNISPEEINKVVEATKPAILPNVFAVFWSFRLMVFLGLFFFLLFAVSAYLSLKKQLERNRWILHLCMWSIPLPVLATEFGWITAEAGRQPWTVFNKLPTFLSSSTHNVTYMVISLTGFAILYSIFIAAELYLMFKFARLGPEEHDTHATHQLCHILPAPPQHIEKREKGEDFIMDIYTILKLIWGSVLCLLMIALGLMVGMDMGVGTLLRLIGKNDAERRTMLNIIGPHWDGNQVWFVLSGGAIFAAFPTLYATSFSVFYLVMIMLLFSMILRPVAFEYRSKAHSTRWRESWDWAFLISGFLPMFVYGAAFGNILSGVGYHFSWTGQYYQDSSFISYLLNPFVILCGLLSVSLSIYQGGIMLMMRSNDPIYSRARNYSRIAGVAAAFLFIAGGVVIFFMQGFMLTEPVNTAMPANPLHGQHVARAAGAWLHNYSAHPMLWLLPALGLGSMLCGSALVTLKQTTLAWLCGMGSWVGVIGTVAAAMFPFLMPSTTQPDQSLTLWNSTGSLYGLSCMLIFVCIFIPLIVTYTSWCYYVMRGKVNTADIVNDPHSY